MSQCVENSGYSSESSEPVYNEIEEIEIADKIETEEIEIVHKIVVITQIIK